MLPLEESCANWFRGGPLAKLTTVGTGTRLKSNLDLTRILGVRKFMIFFA